MSADRDDEPPTDPKTKETLSSAPNVTRRIAPFDEAQMFHALQQTFERGLAELRVEQVSAHKELREHIRLNASMSLEEHDETRRRVGELASTVDTMRRHIFGKDEPPKSGGGLIPKPIPQSISEHDATIAGLQGQLLAVDSRTNAIERKVDTLTDLQKKQMGMRDEDDRGALRKLADGFVWILTDRAGRKFALTLIAALSGLTTSCGTIYALSTGRLPMPNNSTTHEVAPQSPPH